MAKSGGSRMTKPCECCEKYLKHLDEKNQNMTCFLRRMTGNFKLNMTVPNRFLKNFTGEFLGSIKLESPDGCLYDVQVTGRYNKMVLGHGWEAFVDAHHIKENDSVLFRHIEECCFEVLIFDSDGCEKMFPCAGIKNIPSVREGSVYSINISSSSEHHITESSGSFGNTARMAVTSSSSDMPGKGISSASESFELDDLDYVISSRSYLSNAQKQRVTAVIKEIEPEVTVFVAIMWKTHVQPPTPFMAITKEYALAHFPRETKIVTLQMSGSSRQWHPKFYKIKNRNEFMLTGKSWLDFVRDNHIQEGDICILLPTKGARKFKFRVHLLRATDAYFRGGRAGTCFQRIGPHTGRSDAEMGSKVHIKEEPTDGDSEMHADSNDNLENEDFGGPSQPPYVVASRKRLSRFQKKIVEEKVRAIQSELPICIAVMGKNNVGKAGQSMLELGSRYARAVDLPASSRQTLVLQYMGKIWKTEMVVQRSGRQFLGGGWSTFVRDNGLRIGDICLLELKKNKRELTMTVRIISRKFFI